MNVRAHIIVLEEEKEQSRYDLEPGEYLIGRNPDCPLRVESRGVSRRHARLTCRNDGTLLIEDMGSSTGTYLDGVQLTAPTVVQRNQSIQMGRATLRIEQPMAGDASGEALPFEISPHTRYELGPEIAKGGMGVVFSARQPAIHREVAMKVMLPEPTAWERQRFIQEAQITGQLEHPNIVPVHGLALDEQGQPYYTMKLVKGRTLEDILKLLAKGDAATIAKYPLAALLILFQKVCDAMAFAHARGVLHRDLKPANIMAGDYGEVLVMDWGLAKMFGRDGSPSPPGAPGESALPSHSACATATLVGAVIGTPHYMSPEQARGEIEDLDGRSDIYALGAILFDILHLRTAFTGYSADEILAKVSRGAVEWEKAEAPHQPSTAVENRRSEVIPASLLAVCQKALALDREQRYWTVEELQADLAAYQNGFATSAENAGQWKQFTLLVARHKALSVAVAGSLLLILGITAAFTVRLVQQRNSTAAQRERALAEEKSARETNAEKFKESQKAEEEERTERAAKETHLQEANRAKSEASAAQTAKTDAAKERDRATAAKAEAKKATEDAVVAKKTADELIHFMQYDLRASLGKLGQLKLMDGVDQRIREYEERHLTGEGANAEMRATSASFEQQGEILLVQGHLSEALQEYREARTICQRLAEKDPNSAAFQYDVYRTTTKVGDILHSLPGTQQRSEALDCYRQAVAIVEALARKEPNNARWRNEVMAARKKLADALQAGK